MATSPRGDRADRSNSAEGCLMRNPTPVAFELPSLSTQIDAVMPTATGGLFLECSVTSVSCKGSHSKRFFYWELSVTGSEIKPTSLPPSQLADMFANRLSLKPRTVSTLDEAKSILAEQLAHSDESRPFVTLYISDAQAYHQFVDILRKQSSRCRIVLRTYVRRSSSLPCSAVSLLATFGEFE
jgi:hypothetical protein